MAKNFRRMLAMVLVMCMFVSALPMQALAAESEDVPFTTTDTMTGGDVSIDVTPSGDVKVEGTNGSGESVKIEGSTSDSGTSLSGNVDSETPNYTYNESVSTNTTTHPDGSTQSVTVTEGSETKEWTGDGVENVGGAKDTEDMEDVKLPSVEVELIPGKESEPVTVTGKVEGQIGDVKEGENDTEYDYTDVTIEADRTVSAEASDITVTVNKSETHTECPVAPEDYEGKHKDNASMSDPQAQGLGTQKYHDMVSTPQAEPEEDGYDFFFSGNGDWTDAAVPVFKYIVYQRYEEGDELPEGCQVGDIKLDNDKNPLVDESKSYLIDAGDIAGAYDNTGMKYQAAQLELKNGNEFFYTYCADYLVEVDQEAGHRYKMENLEDSGHYTEEDAAKLRAIVENAYWGTENDTGSLAEIKANLEAYAKDNPKVIVQDKNGDDVEYDLATILSGLKEHEALAVSQAAIWAYSINRTNTAYESGKLPAGVDNVTVVGAQSAIKAYRVVTDKGGNPILDENGNPTFRTWLYQYAPANNQADSSFAYNGDFVIDMTDEERAQREAAALESDARMKALFEYLMALDGVAPTVENNVTTIINEKNCVEDMSLVVHDRAANNVNNLDDNNDNDVYNISLNFQLAFTPGENDELYVDLMNGDPENPAPICDANNNPIRKKLVNENFNIPEGEEQNYLKPNENGVYTLSGMQVSENTYFTFDLQVNGTQHLENGVYLYTAAGGRLASQTFVGMATGSHDVNVGTSMTVKFNVDENNHVVTEHHWRNESDPVITPPTTPPEYPVTPMDYVEEDVPAPQIFRLNNQNEELVEIPEEPVPLATPVVTGDNSGLWVAVILIALCGIVAVNVFDKKRQHESF